MRDKKEILQPGFIKRLQTGVSLAAIHAIDIAFAIHTEKND